MISNEPEKPNRYLVLEEDFLDQGIVVLNSGTVYPIENNVVVASNGVSYIAKLLPVLKNLFKEYPQNKFVVYFEDEDTLDHLKSLSIDSYKPQLIGNVLFITTKDVSFNEIKSLKGVTNVRYQRVGKLLNEKGGN